MGNILVKIKRFFQNKNTVTIICVLAGILVLYIGYNWRVNSATQPVSIPYAKNTLESQHVITRDDIGYVEVASSVVEKMPNLIRNANLLIGKEVTLMDPDDTTKTITGVVEEAVFYQNGCAVKVNGKEYPAGLILSAKAPSTTTPPADGSDTTTGDSATGDNTNTDDNSSIAQNAKAVFSNAATVSKTAAAFSYLGNLFSELTK